MTRAEFIEEIELILNEDEGSLSPESVIADIQGWDSTGMLGVIALLDGELEISINVDSLRACKTLNDLITMASDKLAD
jgi:acyl carrier protein